MKQILIITICLLTACGNSTHVRREIGDLVRKIDKHNILEHQHVGVSGMTTVQYLNFIKLGETATEPELLSLLKHNNSVVRGYASWALADRKYPKLEEILISFLETADSVTAINGCEMSRSDLAGEFYYRVYYQEDHDRKSRLDSIFLIKSKFKMDSVIVYGNYNTELLKVALENNYSKLSTYNRIKELVIENGNMAALVELAKYNRPEDIPVINRYGDKSFSAISFFPNTTSWNMLLSFKNKSHSLDYFMAIASYKSKEAVEALNDVYQSCDSVQVNHLYEALIKNYCPLYENLLLDIWEKHKTIDLIGTKKLLNDCPKESASCFLTGLYNNKNFNFLELDYNYGTSDSILPLILKNVAYYHKDKIPEVCNKYIPNLSFMDLSAFLDLIEKNNLIETTDNLLLRLSKKNYPFEIFEISETLLSFNNSSINERVEGILTDNKNDWDKGNWSDAFNTLFKQHKLEIK